MPPSCLLDRYAALPEGPCGTRKIVSRIDPGYGQLYKLIDERTLARYALAAQAERDGIGDDPDLTRLFWRCADWAKEG